LQVLDYSRDPPVPTDPAAWHPTLRDYYTYFRSIAPAGLLPGRQHFDPVAIAVALPRLVLLDVQRAPLRYRYRLVGTKEVELYGHDPTGRWYDEVRPRNPQTELGYIRLQHAVERGVLSYRKGPVLAIRHREHQSAENLVCPFASDGRSIDMITVCGVIFRGDGSEV
jgi:hypothetical protein